MSSNYYELEQGQVELVKIQLIGDKNYLTILDEILMDKEPYKEINDDKCFLILSNIEITSKHKHSNDVVFCGIINKNLLSNILK